MIETFSGGLRSSVLDDCVALCGRLCGYGAGFFRSGTCPQSAIHASCAPAPRSASGAGSTRSARSTRGARSIGLPRRGRCGLIGMLLSIVVAVVIIVAIFAVYNQVTAAANAAQTAVFVRQLAPQITSQYRGDYTGLDNAAAISSGFVPENWRSGTNIVSPSGAQVTIEVTSGKSGRFIVTFDGGIPVVTCKAVLGALKSDPAFFNATIGGGNHLRSAIATPAAIASACENSASGDFRVRFQ